MIRVLGDDVQHHLRSGVALTSYTQAVEELVLNALDARSTCVAVRVDLGLGRIQVVDNGHGISCESLTMVGTRYATSKCHGLSDLDNLIHYGYRGEALSSIVNSCLILEVESRHRTSTVTFSRIFNRGKPGEVTPSSVHRPSHGTTFTIHDLFFSFPVRKKSLNEAIEFESIRHRIESIALVHPRISFSLRNDVTGAKVLQTHKANSVLATFSHLFGTAKSRYMKQIDNAYEEFRFQGYISTASHSNKNLQFVYINDRIVLKTRIHKLVNFLLSKSSISSKRRQGAMPKLQEQKYLPDTNLTPPRQNDRFGIFVINISCPLSVYDITFDPAKTLVEFHHWEIVLKCVEDGVKNFLVTENLVGEQEGLDSQTGDDKSTTMSCDNIDTSSPSQQANYGGSINTSEISHSLSSVTVKRISSSLKQNSQMIESLDINKEAEETHPSPGRVLKEAKNTCEQGTMQANKCKGVVSGTVSEIGSAGQQISDGTPSIEEQHVFNADPDSFRSDCLDKIHTNEDCTEAFVSCQHKQITSTAQEVNSSEVLDVNIKSHSACNYLEGFNEIRKKLCVIEPNLKMTPCKKTNKEHLLKGFQKIRAKLGVQNFQEAEVFQGNTNQTQCVNSPGKGTLSKKSSAENHDGFPSCCKSASSSGKRASEISFNDVQSHVPSTAAPPKRALIEDQDTFSSKISKLMKNSCNSRAVTSSCPTSMNDFNEDLCEKSVTEMNTEGEQRQSFPLLNKDLQKSPSSFAFEWHPRPMWGHNDQIKNSLSSQLKEIDSETSIRQTSPVSEEVICSQSKSHPELGTESFKPLTQESMVLSQDSPVLQEEMICSKELVPSQHALQASQKCYVTNRQESNLLIDFDEDVSIGPKDSASSAIPDVGSCNCQPGTSSSIKIKSDLHSLEEKLFDWKKHFLYTVSNSERICSNAMNAEVSDFSMPTFGVGEVQRQISECSNSPNSSPPTFHLPENCWSLSPSSSPTSSSSSSRPASPSSCFLNEVQSQVNHHTACTRINGGQLNCNDVSDKIAMYSSSDVSQVKKEKAPGQFSKLSPTSNHLVCSGTQGFIPNTDIMETCSPCELQKSPANGEAGEGIQELPLESIADSIKNVFVDDNGLQMRSDLNDETSESISKPPITASTAEQALDTGTANECRKAAGLTALWSSDSISQEQASSHSSEQWLKTTDYASGNSRYKPPDVDKLGHLTPEVKTSERHHFLGYNAGRLMPRSKEDRREEKDEFDTLTDVGHVYEEHQSDINTESNRNSKWKDGCPVETSGDGQDEGVVKMYCQWTNPAFQQPEKAAVSSELGGLPSSTALAHQVLSQYSFTKRMLPSLKVINQMDNKFIVCLMKTGSADQENENLLVIIDQHAAHERVRLEKLIEDAYEEDADDGSRRLRVAHLNPPLSVHLTQDKVRLMKAYSKHIHKSGVVFMEDKMSRDRVDVHGVPACLVLREANEAKRGRPSVATDLVQLLEKTHGANCLMPKTVMRVLASQACHGAIKFGDALCLGECERLVRALSTCDLPFQCAHGRPSIMPLLNLHQIPRLFPAQQARHPQLQKLHRQLTNMEETDS